MNRGGFLIVAALLAGCVGDITTVDPGPVPEGPRNLCEAGGADLAGPRLLRRLTGDELVASIRAVYGLGAAEWTGPAVPADAAGRNGFTNNVDRLIVDDAYAAGLLVTAEGVADAVVAPATLTRVLPCAGAGDPACARTYLDTIGRRLFRRPLTDAERQRYLDLHAEVTGNGDDFATWVRWATVALVQSPHFIYRSELGERDGDGYRLTGYELATALAFGLTGAPPSDALLDLAEAGGLDTADGVAAAARDLAIDPTTGTARPAFRAVFLSFTDQWLGLSSLANLVKSADLFPGFSPEIRAAMRRETDDFLEQVVFEEDGSVTDLLTSPVSVVDPALAAYYGWPAGTGPVARPAGWGVGLLAQGSVLSIGAGNEYTSPTQRGLLVRERLLCTEMPPPPPIVGDIPPPTGSETTRQRYEAHSANIACVDCHKMMDPIGFAFEHLDAAGRYRETEGPFPIDDSGAIIGLGADLAVVGPTDLAEALAADPTAASCMAAYMASQTYGLDHHDTPCLVTSLADQLAAGSISIVDYYLALASTRHFTHRTD